MRNAFIQLVWVVWLVGDGVVVRIGIIFLVDVVTCTDPVNDGSRYVLIADTVKPWIAFVLEFN